MPRQHEGLQSGAPAPVTTVSSNFLSGKGKSMRTNAVHSSAQGNRDFFATVLASGKVGASNRDHQRQHNDEDEERRWKHKLERTLREQVDLQREDRGCQDAQRRPGSMRVQTSLSPCRPYTL